MYGLPMWKTMPDSKVGNPFGCPSWKKTCGMFPMSMPYGKDGGAYEKGRAANVQVVFAFFSFVYCCGCGFIFPVVLFCRLYDGRMVQGKRCRIGLFFLEWKSRICLPDSTFVWLNAGSTLEYFVSRWTKERNVRLDGEAYFEVAADPDRLFVVEGGGVVVKVHGTVFNMKAREKQDHVDVSLLSGLVVVENHGVSRSLNPGETAVCKKVFPA